MRIKYRVSKAIYGRSAALRKRGVSIGSNCRVLSDLDTSEPWLISIGDNVTVSTNVTILTHDGVGWLFSDLDGRRFRYARVSIGSQVFIGSGAIIMPGVKIEDKCIVGAGSVVTKSVPSGYIVAGSPARVVGHWDDLRRRVFSWPSEANKVGEDYRQRIDSIVDSEFVRFIDTKSQHDKSSQD